MARSIAVAAVLLALVASAAAVGTNEPTASPTSPTAAPTTPTAAPTTPTAAPTTPTAAPTTPTAAPTTPTAAPTTPTAAPTSPTAAPTTPTVAPTSPTVAPTPTPSPTRAPVPATCSSKAQYRAPGGCNNCVSRSSPYTKVFGGSLCYNPTTLSSQSTVCTPHVLPAFIRSNIDKSKTVSCINPQKKLVTLFLVTKNSNIDFLSSAAYIKTSLRLAGAIPPVKLSNGAVKYIKSNGRILVQFEDTFGVLRKKYGLTVQLTGSLKHGPGLLNQCFNAFLKVCG